MFWILSPALNAGAQVLSKQQANPPARVITVNYTTVKGRHNTFFREVVGAGRAAEGLRADWQRDLITRVWISSVMFGCARMTSI